jgi:hypothetical protein
MRQTELISQDYLHAQRTMHANPRGYGGRGYVWTSTVLQIADRYKAISILDYGCGQGTLMHAIRLVSPNTSCREYDPAIVGKDGRPEFADLVVCTDVLEHIEPDKLDAVLAHIRGLARKAAFLVVATRPANKLLPSGENAHLIIEPDAWWEARVLGAGFTLQDPPTVHPDKMPGKCWIAVVTP